MLKTNQIFNMHCLDGIKLMLEQNMQVDLIVTDPPYYMPGMHKVLLKSPLAKSLQNLSDELIAGSLVGGIEEITLKAMWDVMKVPNIYLWCNCAQIPQYIRFFVTERKCKMDMLIWHKTNAMPLYNNKYLTDKEYCLYFRRGAFCNPQSYEKAKTVYELPINIKDKQLYKHPTIKPLSIIRNIVENSSKPDYLVLDPFMGSGTTAVACKELGRRFIGFEINTDYYKASLKRLASIS